MMKTEQLLWRSDFAKRAVWAVAAGAAAGVLTAALFLAAMQVL